MTAALAAVPWWAWWALAIATAAWLIARDGSAIDHLTGPLYDDHGPAEDRSYGATGRRP